jgi:hypothetical protein
MFVLSDNEIDAVTGGFSIPPFEDTLVEEFRAFRLGQPNRFGSQPILEPQDPIVTPPTA